MFDLWICWWKDNSRYLRGWLKKALTTITKRLSPIIEENKRKTNNDIDEQGTKDTPFENLYKRLLKKTFYGKHY